MICNASSTGTLDRCVYPDDPYSTRWNERSNPHSGAVGHDAERGEQPTSAVAATIVPAVGGEGALRLPYFYVRQPCIVQHGTNLGDAVVGNLRGEDSGKAVKRCDEIHADEVGR